jgi:hypothetical protein
MILTSTSIVAVPGLGTDPEECWTWNAAHHKEDESDGALPRPAVPPQLQKQFNWLKDRDGLAQIIPESRIMIYSYASAWMGRFKVKASMREICAGLLTELSEKRKVCPYAVLRYASSLTARLVRLRDDSPIDIHRS